MQAISLDIKNAFNSVPRAEVIRALNEAGAPLVLIGYVKNFLELRHSEDVRCEVCGVPQGDPLSMFLFCMALERLLRRPREAQKSRVPWRTPSGRQGAAACSRAPAYTGPLCVPGSVRAPCRPFATLAGGDQADARAAPWAVEGCGPTTGADAEHQPHRANSK